MTTYICNLYYPPQIFSHCCLWSQNPDYHSGGHPRPLTQRTAAIRAHEKAKPTLSCHLGNSYPLRLQKRKGVYGRGWGGGRHEQPRNTYICTHILHVYTHPSPPPPTPTPVPPPFHALLLCGVQVSRSVANSRERRGGEGRGRGGRER